MREPGGRHSCDSVFVDFGLVSSLKRCVSEEVSQERVIEALK